MTPELARLKIIATRRTRARHHRMRWNLSRQKENTLVGKCFICKLPVILDGNSPSQITGDGVWEDCVDRRNHDKD